MSPLRTVRARRDDVRRGVLAAAVGTLALAVAGCTPADPAADLPPVEVDAPAADDLAAPRAEACEALLADLPATLDGQPRRELTDPDVLAVAWGDPAIVLRCGGPPPAEFDRVSECVLVDDVAWFFPGRRPGRPGGTRGGLQRGQAPGRRRGDPRGVVRPAGGGAGRPVRTGRGERAGARPLRLSGPSRGQRRPVGRFERELDQTAPPARGSPRPEAAHIRGNSELGVKPGIVLISLTTRRPSASRKKSTRARPSQDITSKASTASLPTSAVDLRVEVGRYVEPGRLLGEVLRGEVVEVVGGVDDDLGRHAGLGPTVAQGVEHAALDLARAGAGGLLDDHLGVPATCLLDRGVELLGGVDLADADAGAAAAGLDEDRDSRAPRPPSRTRSGSCAPGAVGDDHPGQRGQARRTRAPSSCTACPCRPRRPAPPTRRSGTSASSSSPWTVPSSPNGPCSSGKTASTAPELLRHLARRPDGELAPLVEHASVGRLSSTWGRSSAEVEREVGGVGRLEDPAAVGRDADRHHVVLLGVDRGQHAAGGHAGDRVLAGAAPEEEGDARTAGRTLGVTLGRGGGGGGRALMVRRPYPPTLAA